MHINLTPVIVFLSTYSLFLSYPSSRICVQCEEALGFISARSKREKEKGKHMLKKEVEERGEGEGKRRPKSKKRW